MSHLQQKNTAKARAAIDKALKAYPDFPDAHLALGQVLMSEKQFGPALREFETARDRYAAANDALYQLRMLRYEESFRRAHDLRESIRSLQEQQRFAKGSTTNLDGQIQALENQLQQAESAEQPTHDGPGEPPGEVYFWIGNAQFNLERLPLATESWRKCVERSPKFAPGWNNLAVALWKQGRGKEALDLLSGAQSSGVAVNESLVADLSGSQAP
jgi:tetratricopeptide (TPR) repeat protein